MTVDVAFQSARNKTIAVRMPLSNATGAATSIAEAQKTGCATATMDVHHWATAVPTRLLSVMSRHVKAPAPRDFLLVAVNAMAVVSARARAAPMQLLFAVRNLHARSTATVSLREGATVTLHVNLPTTAVLITPRSVSSPHVKVCRT